MEAKTGFEKNGGTKDRSCHICRYMLGSVCLQPDMERFSRQPKDADGMPYVDRNDVCNFFEPKRSVGRLLRGE